MPEVKEQIEEKIKEEVKGLRESVDARIKEAGKELTESQKSALEAEVEKATKAIEEKGYTSNEDVTKAIEEAQEKWQEQFDELATKFNRNDGNQPESFKAQIERQLGEQMDTLKQMSTHKKTGEIILTVKDAATETTGNVTLPSATPASYTYQQVERVIPAPEMIPFVMNYTDNAPTDKVSLPWVDEVSSEGDADFIGEGVVKPLIDVDYEIRYSNAKKVAGKIKVSEEALTDIPFMSNEINRKLRQRHDLAKQDGILNGDGTGADLKGITEYAAAFAAGGLANSVDDANNYDVIVAAYNQVLVASDGNYIPSAVFVHPTDATNMRLTKDADGNYVMPPFSAANGEVVNGVRVVQNTKIPVGYFLLGDFSKSHVRDYVDFTTRIGYVDDDFEKNLVTIIGESRVHHYISENEEKAFVYDQFSVAKTALDPELT